MSEWSAKVVIAAIIAYAITIIFIAAAQVGIERTHTCRDQPQLCDTERGPRLEEEK